MTLKLITAPAVEPLNIQTEVRPHVRVDFDDDDALLLMYAKTARQYLETHHLRRALITQTWDLYLDSFPGDVITLPLPPLQSVTGVYYTPESGVEQTVSASSYYVDTVGEPGRVLLKNGYTWPSDTLQVANGVRVRFVCGYGAAGNNVPSPIRQAMLLTIGDLYENRENTVIAQGVTIQKLPNGAEMLLYPYRIIGW